MRIFLSLGTNIGDRAFNLHKALKLIDTHSQIAIISESKIYETSPLENEDQDYFLNQIIEIQTKLDPLDLLDTVKDIECSMGRIKMNKRYQPRIIDIDILSYNDLILNDKILNIPHSKIKFRKFILKPWTDIAPDYILPNSKDSIKELLECISHLKDEVREYN